MNDTNDNVTNEDNPIEELDYLLPDDYVEGEEYDFDGKNTEEDSTTDEEETKEEVDTDEEETETKEDDSAEEETEEEVKEELPLDDLEIKVLGEVKKLSEIPREELQSTVRKGQDYDRVKDQLTDARSEINEWHEVAEMFDMSPTEVIETLKEQHFKQKAESEGRNVDDVKSIYNANRKSRTDKMYETFVDKYPDVKVDELPQEVKDDIAMGKDVTKSYENHLSNSKLSDKDSKISELQTKIDDLEKAIKIKEQNTKSKKKGVVKKTSGSDGIEHDDFMDGFLGN